MNHEFGASHLEHRDMLPGEASSKTISCSESSQSISRRNEPRPPVKLSATAWVVHSGASKIRTKGSRDSFAMAGWLCCRRHSLRTREAVSREAEVAIRDPMPGTRRGCG